MTKAKTNNSNSKIPHRKKADAVFEADKYNGYTDLLITNNLFRSFIRRSFYIRNILKFVKGKTIDFGCGVGEVLKYLPDGSLGLDPDNTSVKYCQSRNLNAKFYDIKKAKYSLEFLKNQKFETLLMNHVLEHIDNPEKVMTKLLEESKKINLKKIIVVVPCKIGYEADETHVQYIIKDFFENNIKSPHYKIVHTKYYPINNRFIGNIFRYQELVIVYEINK